MTKEQIKTALKDKAWKKAKIKMDLDNPQTLQEKITWLMIYDDKNDLKSKCADKIKIHEYCKEKLGKDICVPILKVYNDPKEINLNELPNSFVIKCNHGYNMNIIVKDKHNISNDYIVETMNKHLLNDFGKNNFQEHYAKIERKCFAEKFMYDTLQSNSLIDYKFWCFNGQPRFVGVNNGHGHGDITQYDMNFNQIYLYPKKPDNEYIHFTKPKNFEKMVEYAKILSSEFRFVRVDFYEVNGTVYLGELTFTPGAGLFKFKDQETNLYWGSQLNLNK